ncbi:DMT family transporter [Leucobacter luti]|uniref:DMT family transporter n=1 Tax=Leucobacter luti TaxID=340320 RepID=UPI001C68ACC3|nr:EamA family transporter [Leucobacter luti]QYM76720.1 EamA family transporter [Leucobacter luti]
MRSSVEGAQQNTSSPGGALLVLAAAVLWGTTGTAATFAPSAGPIAIGAAAMGVGGLLQAAVAVRALRRDAVILRAHPVLVLLGAVSVAIYPLAFYAGMHLAGVAVGTVVALASGPLFAAILERVIDRSPLGTQWLVSAGLGLAGTVLLTIDGAAGRSSGDVPLGVGLALIAGATYALYTWVARRLMGAGAGSRAAMGSVFGIGGLLLVPVLIVSGGVFLTDSRNLAVGVYMALVPMFLGYLWFGMGLRTVSAKTATALTLAEPAVAAVLAWWIVGERLGVLGLAGIACIALCLAGLSWRRS